ncbi:STAS-like domain-containing protein [Ekhidna sp.]|uniref:STAS-like domain-containing protein n=1 Tax=Ekhidna sp. TaxID=2608089 RepID=UPI003B5AD773
MSNTILNIEEIIGGTKAISSEDGDLVFNKVKPLLEKGEAVSIDFENIELIVSTFLNASVGQLYGSFSSDYIKDHFSVLNMVDDDLRILQKVVTRAKQYFANRESFSSSVNEAMNNG